MRPTTHTLSTARTARYHTLGGSGEVREVFFACHGYGQLAPRFLSRLAPLAAPHRLAVAPEALSRFYLDDQHTRVGASWMTREAREPDIADYVAWLDTAFADACTQAGVAPDTVRLTAFGFSQGTATVTRWLDRSPLLADRARRADRLVLWGSGLPHDLDLGAARWLEDADLTLVMGDTDPIATPGRVLKLEGRLAEAVIPYRLIEYAGGHRLNDRVLERLAADSDG